MKYLLLLLSIYSINAQELEKKILWNKIDNVPVEYATIKYNDKFVVSNSEGKFEFAKEQDLTIQSVGFNTLKILYNDIAKKDTIYIEPKIFTLDEVTIKVEDVYKKMVKTVLAEYAFIPHTEKFYLRVVVKKNRELYKIIDFSGLVEKQTLFATSKNPLPKNNFKVQIDNIRKAGTESKTIDYELYNFDDFFMEIAKIVLHPDHHKLRYETTNDNSISKIVGMPKDIENNFTSGFYILNSDDTFSNAEIVVDLKNSPYQKIGKHKHRTSYFFKNSSFERNKYNNKMQLNKAIFKATTELLLKDSEKEIFEVTYMYFASPVENVSVKNNINLKKDMFDLKMEFNADYWKNNEILPLTDEMQTFVNKVNDGTKSKEFRNITNIK